MRAVVAYAIALLAACNSTRTQDPSAEGWADAPPAAIAEAFPEFSVEPGTNALVGARTRLRCPAYAGDHPIVLGRANSLTEECVYHVGIYDGIWAVGVDAAPSEARGIFLSFYENSQADPEFTVSPPERSSVGVCTLEIWRMYNSRGFWISMRDLYAPSTMHQFRTVAHDAEKRDALEAHADSMLGASVQTLCEAAGP